MPEKQRKFAEMATRLAARFLIAWSSASGLLSVVIRRRSFLAVLPCPDPVARH
jgi:hypothetical protein